MSEDREQFEKQLRRQSLRQPPSDWRQEILSAANAAQRSCPPRPVARGSLGSILKQRLTALLWPHPVAWGGLAAVWIFILAANVQEQAPALAEKTASPTPEVIAEVQQQQHLYAQLLGVSDLPAADRPKEFAPKPRSESMEILAA